MNIVRSPYGVCRAHDIGYGWVKSFRGYTPSGERITHSFPSAICHQVDQQNEDIEQARKNVQRVSVNEKQFIVGNDVRFFQQYGTDQIQHNEYVKTDEYLALLRGAMAYDNEDDIDLMVLGLPQKYMGTHKDYLMNKAKGRHQIGGGRTVNVKNVLIISQPLAAAYNFSRRAHSLGAISREEISRITLTIESGWFTYDWTVSEGLKTYDRQCGSVEGGASIILLEMMKEGSKYTDGRRQLDNLIKFDERWREGHLRFERDDLTSVKHKIDAVRIREAEKYFFQMKNGSLNFKGVERVVATGGSIHLYSDIINREFEGMDVSISSEEDRRWDVAEGSYNLGMFALKKQAK